MQTATAQTKWRIYGISVDTSHNPHSYYGTFEEVKKHCIDCNTSLFSWDYITFEPWED